jgi:riboflavin synthase
MFTGLIAELGEVTSLVRKGEGGRLSVRGREVLEGARTGDSISVNGVCLTVTAVERDRLAFDVSFETLRSTNLGQLKAGDRVNLDPSLRPDSRLGGHFVTGHVEAVGSIAAREPVGDAVKVRVSAPLSVLSYLVEKGSVAVDGISLTVVNVLDDAFTVVIIPHTFGMTTIGFKKPGATVNLEPDILAKYVAKFLSRQSLARTEVPSENPSEDSLLAALKRSGFTA